MSGLRLDAATKRFGGVSAAESVTMEIPFRRITGLIGPNGAGKTTIVNLVTGMLPLTSGHIFFKDRNISEASASEVGRAGIARTFQNIRLLKEATALDNVMVGFHRGETCSTTASLLGLPSARRETAYLRQQAMLLFDRFGMRRFAEHQAGGLAYGHQRRVEMMRALASGPELLLLDEPVAGMNDVEANELGAIFRELAHGGIGVLLIEHNMRFVTGLCDNLYVLDGGRIIAHGAPEVVTHDPAVITAYLGV